MGDPIFEYAWQYQSFPGTNGVEDALTWLNENLSPPTTPLFGNIDNMGDVRIIYYGHYRPVIREE
jgi:hypothetical protein